MTEPYLRIQLSGEAAASKTGQIVAAIRNQIDRDPSLEGLRLPPIRVLAHQLGVSKNTVSAAYEELKAQALIEPRGRQGLYVATASAALESAVRNRSPTASAPRYQVPLPAFKPLYRVASPPPIVPGSLMMSSVFIDPRLLPKEKIAACLRSVLNAKRMLSFSDRQGFLPLREKIAQRLRKRGIPARAEHIVTTIGSQQVLDIVCRSLASDTIATEDPAYYMGKALLEMNGKRLVGLPVRLFEGVDLAQWEKILRREKPGLVYLTPNFQNPTGYSYSSHELARLLEWSSSIGFGILEDDWGSDMLSFSEFRPSLRALGGENVLYMNSFTKKLLPALRIGYLLGNERTVPSLVQSKRVSVSGLPAVIEAALFEFLDRGYYDSHLKKVQAELDRRYRNCLECLRETMPGDVRWTAPGGGPVLWLELPRRHDLGRLAEALRARKIIVQPSDDAFFAKPHLHGFKIGYAFLTPREMQTCIGALVEELRRS